MRPWLIIIPLYALDILTKILARDTNIPITSYLSIHYIQNTGISFGLFPNANLLWMIMSALLLGVLLYLYRTADDLDIPLAFLIAGAVGNLTDRILYGSVVDFLSFTFWPAFNLADTYLVIGMIILIASWTKHKPFNRPKPKKS